MKKKIIILAIFTFLILSESKAQNYSFYARTGDMALQFGVSGLMDLSPKNVNGGLGFQYYVLNNIALRGQLGAGYTNENLDKNLATDFQDYSLNKMEVSFSPGIRFNIAATGNLVLYTGIEGSYKYSYQKEIGKNFKDISNLTKTNYFGAGGFLGVEWFAFNRVSLSAEYNVSAIWSSGKNIIESTSQYIENKSPNALNIDFGQTKGILVISFYF